MTTTTPYSDEWRAHVRRRLFEHGTTAHAIGERTGLGPSAVDAVWGDNPVSLEVTGPIDEAIDRLDAKLEGRTPARSRARLRQPPVRVGDLCEREGANVDALLDARVHFIGGRP